MEKRDDIPLAKCDETRLSLMEQARELLVGKPVTVVGHRDGSTCSGRRCIEIHLLGMLNADHAFDGATPLWGITAPGNLLAEWDIHGEKYTRLYGSFPGPDFSHITVDLNDALQSLQT